MDKMQPYCKGENCPLKENCLRYRENIDIKKESYFAYAPYNDVNKRCEFYVGDPAVAVRKLLDEQIDKSEPSDGAYCE